jgi:hypothetical protein
VCIAASAAMVSPAIAQNFGARLTAGTDVFDYTAGGNSNLPTVSNGPSGNVPMNFQLSGSPGNAADQQIVSGNWFYRINDNRERHFENADGRSLTGSDYVRYRFDQVFNGGALPSVVPNVWAEMDFKIYDTGPNSALCETQVCFHNDSSTPIDVEVFLAVDFHLAADAQDDAYSPLIGGNLWMLTDLPWTGLMYGPGAVGAAVGETGTIMGAMTNGVLNDFTTPLNPGGGTFNNGAALLQFHQIVAGQSMFCPGARLAIGIGMVPPLEPNPFIPEPASAGLMVIGGAMLLVRRSKRG